MLTVITIVIVDGVYYVIKAENIKCLRRKLRKVLKSSITVVTVITIVIIEPM